MMKTTPLFVKHHNRDQLMEQEQGQDFGAFGTTIGKNIISSNCCGCPPTELSNLNQSVSKYRNGDGNQHSNNFTNINQGWILPKYSWYCYVAFYGCLLFFLIIYQYSNQYSNNSSSYYVENEALNDYKKMETIDETVTTSSIIPQEISVLESASLHTMTHKSTCLENKYYSTKTTKMAYEIPFAALFKDTKGEKKFEASSLIKVDDSYYAVCDNSWAISKFSASLTPFSNDNIQIGNPNREEDDSGYEAILHHNQTFYIIRESVKFVRSSGKNNQTLSYHAIIEEIRLIDDDNDYNILDQCRSEFEFEGDSKGFEGAFGMPGNDGEFYIVGLCEGNFCSESKKFVAGHGQMIVMKKNTTDPNDCKWQTVKTISIPKTAHFRDYSDIEVTPSGKTAITTQEDSALWIGYLLGIEDGKIDLDKIAFDEARYELYDFPKSNECLTVYCNIEGITFINDEMIMAVSDKMKNKGKQPYWCLEKDQSIHAFVLP